MPVTSMVRLARIDFATVDPGQLRVAVRLPQSVRPRRRGVRLRIAGKAGGADFAQDFVLSELNEPAELMQLRGEVAPGIAIYGFRLDPSDLPRLMAFRADILKRKERGGGGSLAISVSADACRVAALPEGPIYLTSYLKTAPDADYIPLVRDVDMQSELRKADPSEDLSARIPPCG